MTLALLDSSNNVNGHLLSAPNLAQPIALTCFTHYIQIRKTSNTDTNARVSPKDIY